MLCASAVFAVAALVVLLTLIFSVTMPTAVLISLFSVTMPTATISVLVRTFASVFVQTLVAAFLSVFVQTSVPAFGCPTAPSLALVQGLYLPPWNLTVSLDPSATTSPMVLHTNPPTT